MVASSLSSEEAGNETYQSDHMRLIFEQGFSFSGFERNTLFLNDRGRRFVDISGISGADSIADGRAAVVADFDNDGDSDLFVTNIQGEGHQLFRNNLGHRQHFLRVTLEGKASGRDAFGTVVRLKTALGTQTRIKSGGNGFLALPDPRPLFGLGSQTEIEWLEVVWPSGLVQRFPGPGVGSSVKAVEGDSQLELLKEVRGRLPDPLESDEIYWQKLGLQRGDPLPLLELGSLQSADDGRLDALSSGQPYVINFWATFCGPCIREMPELELLHPRLKEAGYRLIGVSLDEQDFDRVREFGDRLGVTYPLYRTNPESVQRIFKSGEMFIPLSLVVDGQGRVVDIMAGWNAESERKFQELVNK